MIEEWGLSTAEAAEAIGCTIGQFKNVVDRHEIAEVTTRRGPRSAAAPELGYRLRDLFRIRLALDLRKTGLISLKEAIRLANRANVLHGYYEDGHVSFGLVDGELIEMGWRSNYDARVVLPLDGAGEEIVGAILKSIELRRGVPEAREAETAFCEYLRLFRSGQLAT